MTVETINDGRPAGWTEALALAFVAADYSEHAVYGDFERIGFAKLFLHGDWPAILKEYPEFQLWLNKQKVVTNG